MSSGDIRRFSFSSITSAIIWKSNLYLHEKALPTASTYLSIGDRSHIMTLLPERVVNVGIGRVGYKGGGRGGTHSLEIWLEMVKDERRKHNNKETKRQRQRNDKLLNREDKISNQTSSSSN